MNILIADDHPMIHIGLTYILKDLLSDVHVSKAYSGDQMFEMLDLNSIHLMFMDVNMPGVITFSTFEKVMELYPDLKVIIYSQNNQSLYASRFIELGAFAYAEKNISDLMLQELILSVVNGKIYLPKESHETSDVKHPITSRTHLFDKLSNREIEVANLILNGNDNIRVAEKMNISPSTVSTYKLRIYEKFGVTNQNEFYELSKLYHLI